ncbi:hypothetical protein EF910_20875 [Streptomyces sp. WAC07149]|uniref:hypothetical protein n=1 Tax=Streptomyces sp. WAC07149 TaxID=2487425 RepID=UPI000F790650|nr:hypothetical protein [Streptomyces sp. WAC07149]RST03399.1 hypothetical protein EF910_20875 [Streptomyces sp. WAC07149]
MLAIAQSCVEHARDIGSPIQGAFSLEKYWRDQALASHRTADSGTVEFEIDLKPLLRAGLDDIVATIEASSGNPVELWLPDALVATHEAGLDIHTHVVTASKMFPADLVATLRALKGGPGEIIKPLLVWAGYYQTPASLPVLVALLRRSRCQDHVEDLLKGVLYKPTQGETRKDVKAVYDAFSGATMSRDATTILDHAGAVMPAEELLSFLEGFDDYDREGILRAAGATSPWRLRAVISHFRTEIPNFPSSSYLTYLSRGIPQERYETWVDHIQKAGYSDEYIKLCEMKYEPPF